MVWHDVISGMRIAIRPLFRSRAGDFNAREELNVWIQHIAMYVWARTFLWDLYGLVRTHSSAILAVCSCTRSAKDLFGRQNRICVSRGLVLQFGSRRFAAVNYTRYPYNLSTDNLAHLLPGKRAFNHQCLIVLSYLLRWPMHLFASSMKYITCMRSHLYKMNLSINQWHVLGNTII